MKKLPFIIGIPVFAAVLIVGGAMIWKLKTQTVDIVASAQPAVFPNSLEKAGGSKPTSPFSLLFGSQTAPVLSPTPATVAAINADLETVGDDGGAADFSALQEDVSGL